MQTEHVYKTNNYNLSYLLHLPKNFHRNEGEHWPLILFLHGAGERGNNLELVKLHGVPKIAEKGEDFPFIVVSPQCSPHSYWPLEVEAVYSLLNEIIEQYPVDTSRIYLTGLSMGGIGAWHLALSHPEKFAAFAPICGGISIPELRKNEFQLSGTSEELYSKLPLLKNLPIWAFHGDQDPIVPMDETGKAIEQVRKAGGMVKYTVYEGVGHDAWTETYDNPDLYKWFLNQRKE